MPTVQVYNQRNEPVSQVELDDSVFADEVKEHLFHLVVRYQLAKRRAGTHAVKGRSEVSGGGKKPYRQKGTGRARQGSIRAVQWRGGGVAHGPQPRSHAIKVPKKVRRAAMRSALSRRLGEGALWVLDKVEFDAIRTKNMLELLRAFGWKDLLLVVPEKDEVLLRSARNLPRVTVLPVEGLNLYDLLKHQNLAITLDAVEGITARFRREGR